MNLRSVLLLGLGTGVCCAVQAQDSDITIPHRAGLPVGDSIAAAAPGAVQVIYSNLPGHPTAEVPGLPGVGFQPGGGNAHFDRVYGSPNGSWALTAFADLPWTEDEVLLVNGELVVREGTAATWTSGELVGPLDTKVGVNDAGDFVFSTVTNGPAASNAYVVTGGSDGTLGVIAQAGSPAPAMPGVTWGPFLESPTIATDGTVAFVAGGLGGVPANENKVVVQGATVLAQIGVTIPGGQIGNEPWQNFDFLDLWTTPDAEHYLVQGDLDGSIDTDDVVVVDGNVVVQEGVVLPGSGFSNPVNNNGIVGVHMTPGGRYFVRGNNVAGIDWVYSDGQLVARLGWPITPLASENWSDRDYADCFFLHVGNSKGDYVIGGVTNGDSRTNGVLVLNGERVLAREGDPVDLDGNGVFDDDLYLDTFGNDDGYLSDSGLFYFVATLRNGAGASAGQAFLSIQLADDVIFSDGFESP